MEQLLIALPILIFSVVVHEVAHAVVARSQGDNTAFMLGRITLNPLPHLDPIGSILVPGILALTGASFLFGWAKPVPVNPRNFRDYKKGDILVSLAGVTANLGLAVLFTLLLALVMAGVRFAPGMMPTWQLLGQMFVYGIGINLILVFFNLIPIPPLDGSHVFVYLLPTRLAIQYRNLGQYGMLILVAVLFLGGFSILAWPVSVLTAAATEAARSLAGA